MSLEVVNSLATFGTFLVIAATAIAAVVQLRHARSSNQIAAFNELRETAQKSDFQVAEQFVQTKLPALLQDPAFRHQLANPSARTDENRPFDSNINVIGNFYEGMGALVKAGLIDTELVLQIYTDRIIAAWTRLSPVTSIARRKTGDVLWENFEYLTVLAKQWIAVHPKGTYPAGMQRIELKDEWLEADKQYAASLAPA